MISITVFTPYILRCCYLTPQMLSVILSPQDKKRASPKRLQTLRAGGRITGKSVKGIAVPSFSGMLTHILWVTGFWCTRRLDYLGRYNRNISNSSCQGKPQRIPVNPSCIFRPLWLSFQSNLLKGGLFFYGRNH